MSDDAVISHIREEQDIERLRNIAIAWYESSILIYKNEEFYHSICRDIGELIGKEAYTGDDGVVHDSVFCSKLPDLVKALYETKESYKSIAVKAIGVCQKYKDIDLVKVVKST